METFEAVTPPLRGDEASVQQELLQVADEPWSIDEDVQAARGALKLPQPSRLLSLWSRNARRQGIATVTGARRSEVPPQWTPPR